MRKYLLFIFLETLVFPNIFPLQQFQAFCVARFAQSNFFNWTHLDDFFTALFVCSIFHIFIFVQFCSYSKLKLFLAVVYNGENRLSLSFFIFENFGGKHWGLSLKKALFLGRGSVNILIRGLVVTVRIPFVFITNCFHSAFTFMHF